MSSGSTCAVVGCHNNSRKLKNALETFCLEHQQLRKACPCPPPYALHSMPRKEDRKLAWLAALRLKHLPKRVYVCSFHFIDKKPTELHPNPELYLGYDRPPPKKRRRLTRTTLSVTASNQASISTQPPEPHLHSVHTQWEDPSQQDHQYCNRSRRKDVQDKMTQCDEVAYFILQNDADALLYTGIALETFNTLVSTLEGYDNNEFTMPVRDQVLMTLMKLKSNRVIGDLSRQFHISQSMASKIISHWLDKLEEVLRPLIPWLPKETIQATMPEAFKKNFPNSTCIIDCSETLLQKPRNLGSRGESYSHYYSHNTVKYLVAVAPCGLIMFVSAAYGGRCSDKFITMDSGILTYLKPGDEVMADRGFTIKDLLFERKVRLVIPAFTKKRRQLTEEQVTYTRRIANVRIHVERAIRRLKVYKILSQIVPISMAPKVDKILRICAALVNLREDLIRDTQ
uniref:THAP-type domain-containing protein n=1 Tax=Maylandia zebra TaxID=106582 RepID=A0A3P9AYL6_9CICH